MSRSFITSCEVPLQISFSFLPSSSSLVIITIMNWKEVIISHLWWMDSLCRRSGLKMKIFPSIPSIYVHSSSIFCAPVESRGKSMKRIGISQTFLYTTSPCYASWMTFFIFLVIFHFSSTNINREKWYQLAFLFWVTWKFFVIHHCNSHFFRAL